MSSLTPRRRVVIEVRGGVIQSVYTDDDTQVIVVDWDDHETGEADCAVTLAAFPLDCMPIETEAQVVRMLE